MQHTSLLEYIAVFFGIASVWYSRKENILVYPVGLVNTIIYVYISIKGSFIGEASVNFYYTVMSIYGWILWAKKNEKKEHIVLITWSDAKEWFQAVIFFLSFYIVIFLSLTYLKQRFCSGRYTLGRCICKLHCIYRHVAYGPKKSRKLVLVDCNQYCFYSIILCKALCIYKYLLFNLINNGFLGIE